MWYDNLNNKRLWPVFDQIERIPRESGNEEGIRQYLVKWAKEHNFKAIVDKAGNVIMRVPATIGYENIPSIALQGHMDMVCVKREGSKHDFTKDPIDVMEENGIVHAKDTSLGADNGIAIAIILSIFSDPESKHGPLEGIFTVSEETGLYGAFGIEAKNIQSRRLLNLDSEEEGIFFVGCAGGIEIDSIKTISLTEASGDSLKIKVTGALGGHSGGEIHKGRANAIHALARLLMRIPNLQIASISGGTRRNVIPSYAEALITCSNKKKALDELDKLNKELAIEYAYTDKDLKIVAEETGTVKKALNQTVSKRLTAFLFSAPYGVKSMSFAIPGIVETSDNLAIVSMDENEVRVVFSVRSSIESAKLELASQIASLSKAYGYRPKLSSAYPAWTPDPSSKFTKEVASAYKKFTGKKPVITAIHAGLECGILNKAIEGMDSLSLGPNLFDVHSVNEHVEAASAERVADFVKYLLEEMKP